MGFLDGGIQALFGTAFSLLYLPGTLTRERAIADGEGGGTASPTSQDCRLQIDACTEEMRNQDGYSAKDVRLLILQASIDGLVATDSIASPTQGPRAGETFQIRFVTQDPASAYWECRATKI